MYCKLKYSKKNERETWPITEKVLISRLEKEEDQDTDARTWQLQGVCTYSCMWNICMKHFEILVQ